MIKKPTFFILIFMLLFVCLANQASAGTLELISVRSDTQYIVKGLSGIEVVLKFSNTGSDTVNSIETPTLLLLQNSDTITDSFTITSVTCDTSYPIDTFYPGNNATCTFTITATDIPTKDTIYLQGIVSGTYINGSGTPTETSDYTADTSDSFYVLTSSQGYVSSFNLFSGTVPIKADGSGTIAAVAILYNTGTSNGYFIVDTSYIIIKNSESTDITSSFNISLQSGTTYIYTGADTKSSCTWIIEVPNSNSSSILGKLTASLNISSITIQDALSGVNQGSVSDSTSEENIFYLAGVYKYNSAAAGGDIDTISITMENVTVSASSQNNQAFVDTSGFKNGDSVLILVQRGETTSIDTPFYNTNEYTFTDAADFDNKITAADSNFFSTNTETGTITNGLLVISLWQNNVYDTYIGDSSTLIEDVTVSVGKISYAGLSTQIKVIKLVNNAWIYIDTNPTVTYSGGYYTVSFNVSSDSTSTGAGFSVFRIIFVGAKSGGTASDIVVYPNPFIPYDGNTATGEYGTGVDQGIFFGALENPVQGFPASTEIKIYSSLGEEVSYTMTNSGGLIQWDAKTKNGGYASSGIYLFVIKTPNGDKKIGKFAIIR